jgi:xanthine/uracil permease
LSALHLLVFSSILPICCNHLWPPVLSTIVVCYLSSSLTKIVVSRWSLSRKSLSHFWSPNPIWLMTILNIFFVKLLLCKPT